MKRRERGRNNANRRRAPRVLHADLLNYHEKRRDGLYLTLGTGRTLDISETGVRAMTPEPLPLGKILSFEVKIQDSLHRFRGRVVWCAEVEADRRYECGLRFEEVDFGLARSLWELTGDVASTDQIRLSSGAAIESLAPAAFSPLSNRPLASANDLATHLGATVALDDKALEELFRQALALRESGTLGTAAELRDAFARIAASLAHPASLASASNGDADGPLPLGPLELAKSKTRHLGPEAPAPTSAQKTPAQGVPAIIRKKERMTPPPRPGGMAGHFKGDQLVEFVQMLGLTRRTGILEVLSAERAGHVAFRNGRIVAARTQDDLKGEVGIHAILCLSEGDFRFRPDLVANLVVEHDLPVEGVLLEVARRRDESTGDPGRNA